MKKRIAGIVLALVIVLASVSMVFASGLEITGITPKDGQKGLQTTNIAVKVKFNQDVSNEGNDATNQTKFVLKGTTEDSEGKITEYSFAKGNVKLVHSDKYPNELWYVLEGTINPNEEYKIEILEGIKASSGDSLGAGYSATFKTRNTKTDGLISVLMMVGMMVIMVVATQRATKKAAADNDPKLIAKKKEEALNPYKIAKEKNISIEEAQAYVEKEKARQKKEQEKADAEIAKKEAAKKAAIDDMEAKVIAQLEAERKEYVYHVKGPKSITLTGRAVPKAIAKQKKKSAEAKLAREKAEKAQREANNKGRKSKK